MDPSYGRSVCVDCAKISLDKFARELNIKADEASKLDPDDLCKRFKLMKFKSMAEEMHSKEQFDINMYSENAYDEMCKRYDTFKEITECKNIKTEEMVKKLNLAPNDAERYRHEELCRMLHEQEDKKILKIADGAKDTEVMTDGTNKEILECISHLTTGETTLDNVLKSQSLKMIKCMDTFKHGNYMSRVLRTLKNEADRLPENRVNMYIQFIEQLAEQKDGLMTIPVPPNTCYIMKNEAYQHIFVIFKESRVTAARQDDALESINTMIETTALNNLLGQEQSVDLASSSNSYHPFIDADTEPLDYSEPNVLRTEKAICFCFDTEMMDNVRIVKKCTDVSEFLRYFGEVKTIKQMEIDVSLQSDYKEYKRVVTSTLGDDATEDDIRKGIELRRQRVKNSLLKVHAKLMRTGKIYSMKDFYFRVQRWCGWYVETEQQSDRETFFNLKYALTLREKVDTEDDRELFVSTQTRKNEYIFTKGGGIQKYTFHMYRSLQKQTESESQSWSSYFASSTEKLAKGSLFLLKVSIIVGRLITNYYKRFIHTWSRLDVGESLDMSNMGIYAMVENFVLFLFGIYILVTNCEWKREEINQSTIESYIGASDKTKFHPEISLVITTDSAYAGVKSKDDDDEEPGMNIFDPIYFFREKYKSLILNDDDKVCTYKNHLGEIRTNLFMNILNQCVVGFSNLDDLKLYMVASLNLWDSFIPYNPEIACVVNSLHFDIRKMKSKSLFQTHRNLAWVPLCLEYGGDYCQSTAFTQFYDTRKSLQSDKEIKLNFRDNAVLNKAFATGMWVSGVSQKNVLEQCAFFLDTIYAYTKMIKDLELKLPPSLQLVKQQFVRIFDVQKYKDYVKSSKYFQKIIARVPIEQLTTAGKNALLFVLSLGSLDEQLAMLKQKMLTLEEADRKIVQSIFTQYETQTRKLVFQVSNSLFQLEVIPQKIEEYYAYALEMMKSSIHNIYNDTNLDWVREEKAEKWEFIRRNFITHYLQQNDVTKSQMRGLSYCFCSPASTVRRRYNIFSILDVKLTELKKITPLGNQINKLWKLFQNWASKVGSLASGCGSETDTAVSPIIAKAAKYGMMYAKFRHAQTRFLIYSITRQTWVWADNQTETTTFFGIDFKFRQFPSQAFSPAIIAQLVAVPTSEIDTSIVKEKIEDALRKNNNELKNTKEFEQLYNSKFLSIKFDELFKDETIIPQAYALKDSSHHQYVSDLGFDILPKLSSLTNGGTPTLVDIVMFIPFILSAVDHLVNMITTLYVATYVNIFLPTKAAQLNDIYTDLVKASAKVANTETESLMESLYDFINLFTSLEGIVYVFRYITLLAHPVFINLSFDLIKGFVSMDTLKPSNGAYILIQPYTQSTPVLYSRVPHQFQTGFSWIQKAVNKVNERYRKSAPKFAFKESDVGKTVVISKDKTAIYFEDREKEKFYISFWGHQTNLNDDDISRAVIKSVKEEYRGTVEVEEYGAKVEIHSLEKRTELNGKIAHVDRYDTEKHILHVTVADSGEKVPVKEKNIKRVEPPSWFHNPHVVLFYEDIVKTREIVKPVQKPGKEPTFETKNEQYVETTVAELQKHIKTIKNTMSESGMESEIESTVTPLPRTIIEMLETEIEFNPVGYPTHFQEVIDELYEYYESATTYKKSAEYGLEHDLTLTQKRKLYVVKKHFTSEGIVFTNAALRSGFTNAFQNGQTVEWWIINPKHITKPNSNNPYFNVGTKVEAIRESGKYLAGIVVKNLFETDEYRVEFSDGVVADINYTQIRPNPKLYVKHVASGGVYICDTVNTEDEPSRVTRANTMVLEEKKETRIVNVSSTVEFIEFAGMHFNNSVDLNKQLESQTEKFNKFNSVDDGFLTTINSDGVIGVKSRNEVRLKNENLFKEDMHLFGLLRLLEHQEHRCKFIGYYNKYAGVLSSFKTGLRFIKTINYSLTSILSLSKTLERNVVKKGEAMLEKFGTQQLFYTLPNGDLISPEDYVNYPNAIAIYIGELDLVYGVPDINMTNLFHSFQPTKTLFVSAEEFQNVCGSVFTYVNSFMTSTANAIDCLVSTNCRNNAMKTAYEQYNSIVKQIATHLGSKNPSHYLIDRNVMNKLKADDVESWRLLVPNLGYP